MFRKIKLVVILIISILLFSFTAEAKTNSYYTYYDENGILCRYLELNCKENPVHTIEEAGDLISMNYENALDYCIYYKGSEFKNGRLQWGELGKIPSQQEIASIYKAVIRNDKENNGDIYIAYQGGRFGIRLVRTNEPNTIAILFGFWEKDCGDKKQTEKAKAYYRKKAIALTKDKKQKKEKIQTIYNWIEEEYQYNNQPYIRNSALWSVYCQKGKEKYALCNSYASMFHTMVNAVGIESKMVGAIGENQTLHMLNKVNRKGEWEYYDLAYGNQRRKTFCGITKEKLLQLQKKENYLYIE